MFATLLQSTDSTDTAGAVGFGVLMLIFLAFIVITLVGYWKLFTKLGLPGWMGVVPFVNVYMIYKARGEHEPVLWLVLSFIPLINIVALWFLASDTAELFGRELGWKLFLFFIPGLSHVVLGFGSAEADRTRIAPGVGLNATV